MPENSTHNSICFFCHSVNNDFLFNTEDIFGYTYQLRRCRDCGCVFLSPPPSEVALDKAYDYSYYGSAKHKFGVSMVVKAVDFFRKKRAVKVSRMMEENQRILDVGCARGDFLRYLSAKGNFELYGVERTKNGAFIKTQDTHIKIQTAPLHNNDFQTNFFDVVTMFHVFEHLENPFEMLKVIADILKPGGKFVVSFPNIASWQAQWFKGKWFHLDPPRHLCFIEPRRFVYVMNSLSFELHSRTYFSMEQNPFGYIQSLLNVFCKKREVLYERIKGNTHYAGEYGKVNVFFQKLLALLLLPFAVFLSLCESIAGKGGTLRFVFINKKS
ncbi:MAG: class I SAM-dependent methyltransferase [Bacteroidales bacterium]|nr:class I SAM-dependent methyltransferase [Bacteroidales bacterium]